MHGDVSPILDRHTQEDLGRMLRERLEDALDARSSSEIDALLESLRRAHGAVGAKSTVRS